METTHSRSEVLIPDQVIDTRFHASFDTDLGEPHDADPAPISRRQRLAATMLLIVLTVAAIAVATVVAVGAVLVAAVVFVVSLLARLAVAISGKRTR